MKLLFQQSDNTVLVYVKGDKHFIAKLNKCDSVWWLEIPTPTCFYADELQEIVYKLKELSNGN